MGAESYSSVRYSQHNTFSADSEVRGCHSAINGRLLPGHFWTVCKMGTANAYQNRRTMADNLSRAVRKFERQERRRQRRRRKQRRGY